jgi:hypothetical protein
MKTGDITGFIDNLWQVVHDSGELAAAVTSYTISGLDGDTDEQYRLISRVVNGYAGDAYVVIQPNADAGNNYGIQDVYGVDTTVTAYRGVVPIYILDLGTSKLSMSDTILNAKSGIVRTAITKYAGKVSGTTVNGIYLVGHSWNNSVDNITSLKLNGSEASCIGIGSRFILLKKVTNSVGMRTGTLDVRGTIKGAWQEVYRTTIGEEEFHVTEGSGTVEYLVVAGGGGGGSSNYYGNAGGGGGAGGYRTSSSYHVTSGSRYRVRVGSGGLKGSNSARGSNGENSYFAEIMSTGGGGGSSRLDGTANSGGSGGGGTGGGGAGAASPAGQGNAGGAGEGGGVEGGGGGGGGAGAAGSGINGGDGLAFHGTYYAGGGAGKQAATNGNFGTAGLGGGGSSGQPGTPNTGGGGSKGGGGGGADGGSGVVIVRYLTGSLVATGGAVTTDGSYTVHTFTTVSAPETSILVPYLLGDTKDQLLRVRVRAVNGYNGECGVRLRINNDSGATAYGHQQVYGAAGAAGASRGTTSGIIWPAYGYALNQVSHFEMILYSKTGFPRVSIVEDVDNDVTGPAVGVTRLIGNSYVEGTNATELTSLVFVAEQPNGLGIGTSIVIERLNL